MTELQDLVTLVRAAMPLIVIETTEENRVLDTFRHLIAEVLRPLYRWSITDGLTRMDMATDGVDNNAAEVALLMAEQVAALRDWAHGHTVAAG